jgi:hypothetical protein
MEAEKRFKELLAFFNKKSNENIKAEQLIEKDAPIGFVIDIDSFTESQIKEFNELDRKYQN